MKFTNAVKKMEALGLVTMDELGDATVQVKGYSLTVVKCASMDEVDAIFTRSDNTGHQRFHRTFKAAVSFLYRP